MFTAQELENITNAALDFHLDKGTVHAQTIQDKPLLKRFMAKQKNFPGGKDLLTQRVKGDYTTDIQGFTHDDTVTYSNPANIKQATFPWKEIHAGINVTMTELKKDGISVGDSNDGRNTSEHSGREMTALANLLDDKLEDMSEGWARGFNAMLYEDGSQDAKEVPGIRSFIVDAPTSALVVAGIDQVANSWWQNRANLAIDASTPSNQNLTKTMSTEFRQLKRFGGRPDTALCGSDWLDALEAELRDKGQYTETGWANKGSIDVGMAEATMKGVTFEYDPTLDDLGFAKRCYVLDFKRGVLPKVMEGENNKRHSPSRPEDKYVIYRAMTWTGGLVTRQRNANGVYAIT